MPVRRAQHAGQAGPVELTRQQVGGGDARDQGQQGAQPDALQPDGGDGTAGHGREQALAQGGQHVPAAAQLRPGGPGQRDRLQQRHHRDQFGGGLLLQRQGGGPVRSDDERELGQQLGHVQAYLQVAGGDVAVTRVEQHDLAVVGQQDPVRGQPAVGDVPGVQLSHRVPDLPQFFVAAAGVALGQGGPGGVLEGEDRGFRPDPDQGAQPRRRRVRVFGRVGQQGPALDGAVHRQRSVA